MGGTVTFSFFLMGKCLLAALYGGGLAADSICHVGPHGLKFACHVSMLIGSNTWWGGVMGIDFRQTKKVPFYFPSSPWST